MRNYIRSTTTTTGLTVKAFLVDRAFQKGRKVSKEQRQTIQLTTATYLSNLELYDCTNIDILDLNQTATLFADSYLGCSPCPSAASADKKVLRCSPRPSASSADKKVLRCSSCPFVDKKGLRCSPRPSASSADKKVLRCSSCPSVDRPHSDIAILSLAKCQRAPKTKNKKLKRHRAVR